MSEYKVVNTFCGKLPLGHHEVGCHNASERRRRAICNLKNIMKEYEKTAMCDEWDTSLTLNNTRGPYRFGIYKPSKKPWDLTRVKSRELIGGEMYAYCICPKRNGLQDECKRLQCRGSPQCRQQPFPTCPPFTEKPTPIITQDPFKGCPKRPKMPEGGVWAYSQKQEREESQRPVCTMPATCTLTCPSSGASKTFRVVPVKKEELPSGYGNVPGPLFKLKKEG